MWCTNFRLVPFSQRSLSLLIRATKLHSSVSQSPPTPHTMVKTKKKKLAFTLRFFAFSAFTIFQYFLRVVPTTYIDASRRKLITSQYAVTDYSRSFEHGKGVPGLFFKYDLEPMSVVIRERTTSLFQFLIRLAGVVGQSNSFFFFFFSLNLGGVEIWRGAD